ncbi:MAG: carbohydrate ABC transporter permease [Sphaerochaetaceae bacterium]
MINKNTILKKIILFIVMIAIGIVTIYPFVWMISSSFKPNPEIILENQTFLPKEPTIQNYVRANKEFNFFRYFVNSIFVSLVVTLVVVYTSTICGYVFAKYRFRGRKILFSLVLSTMMIPWCVTIIPRYSLIDWFGWMDTYKALIIPLAFSGFGIFLLKQFIEGIPNAIIDAARIDGASEFTIFHKIIFKMSRSGIASIAIFQFLWEWEDFLWPYLIINTPEKQLLPVGLKTFSGQYETDYGSLFAATVFSVVPVLIVYFMFQNQFIEGLASSAVKG